MKKKIVAVCIVLICLAILGAGTLSYFFSESITQNVITTGQIKIALQETPKKYNEKGIIPGETFKKTAKIKNTGKHTAWVKIRVDLKTINKKNKEVTIPREKAEELIKIQALPGWKKGKDGSYYYLLAVKPGEVTTKLMDQIRLTENIDGSYSNKPLFVDIRGYGVQHVHNGDTVWQAKGWPAN